MTSRGGISFIDKWAPPARLGASGYYNPEAGGLVFGPRWIHPHSLNGLNHIGASSTLQKRATLGNVRFVDEIPNDKYSWSSPSSILLDVWKAGGPTGFPMEWLPVYDQFGHDDYYDNFAQHANPDENPLKDLWGDLLGKMYIVVFKYIGRCPVNVYYQEANGHLYMLNQPAVAVSKRLYFDTHEDAIIVKSVIGEAGQKMGNAWAALCGGYGREKL